jgi:hypothetical protein
MMAMRIGLCAALILSAIAFTVAWLSETDANRAHSELRDAQQALTDHQRLLDAIISAQGAQGRLNSEIVASLRTVMQAQSRLLPGTRTLAITGG